LQQDPDSTRYEREEALIAWVLYWVVGDEATERDEDGLVRRE
jgi:hypothetical protein